MCVETRRSRTRGGVPFPERDVGEAGYTKILTTKEDGTILL